jgi:hypothetical protein
MSNAHLRKTTAMRQNLHNFSSFFMIAVFVMTAIIGCHDDDDDENGGHPTAPSTAIVDGLSADTGAENLAGKVVGMLSGQTLSGITGHFSCTAFGSIECFFRTSRARYR